MTDITQIAENADMIVKRTILIAILFAVLFSSCEKDENKLVVTNLEYTDCLERPKNLKTTITYYNNTISILHEYLPANCNFQGVLVTPTIDEDNKIIEIDVDPIVVQADLECECEINVSYTFENFYKRNADYTFIIRENNTEIYRGEERL
ncbi:MAG: hypothetical protein IKK36_05495 [Bacteroidales bacterium]|nr:hypothetical protein [Bacteroidales bacterium]